MYPPELERKTTDMGWGDDDLLFVYTSLPEPLVSTELARLASARTRGDTDIVSLQPCPNPDEASQDRVVVEDWPLWGGHWTFRAVFDGHIGHDTADYASAHLPARVRAALEGLAPADGAPPHEAAVQEALRDTIIAFDAGIGEAVRTLFPDDRALAEMSEQDVLRRLDELDAAGLQGRTKVWRGLRGTTALIALVDAARENLWVASLGDCVAVLGTSKDRAEWAAQVLSYAHNGENEEEAERMRAAHPGEPECILNDRVLGIIAVTRALGDFPFKFPPVYTEKLFVPAGECSEIMARKMHDQAARNLTPPYLSGEPQVRHVRLRSGDERNAQALLVMCSDGLGDLSSDRLKLHEVLAPQWVRVAGRVVHASGDVEGEVKGSANANANANAALAVLRDALGGNDLDKVSQNLTVEITSRWMDDTTVLVQRLF